MTICDGASVSLMFTWFPRRRLPVLTADTHFPGMVYFNERNQVNVEEINCALPKRRQEPSQQATGRNTGERASGLRRLSFVGCDE